MSDFKGLYLIRDVKDEDKSFILATFLRGLYYGDSWFSLIPKDIFMDNYKLIAQAIVNNPTNKIMVACLPDDKDVILGYSILGEDFQTIHFCYVKSAWRKNGIARSLCPQRPTRVTHLTGLGRELVKKFEKCIFNPFALS